MVSQRNRRFNKLICFVGLQVSLILMMMPSSSSNPAPKPMPMPGHMVIPFYKRQKELQENERLRIKCEMFLESGYYNDPECGKILLSSVPGRFNSANGFIKSSMLLMTFLLPAVLMIVL